VVRDWLVRCKVALINSKGQLVLKVRVLFTAESPVGPQGQGLVS
jgi:hypothetical protein